MSSGLLLWAWFDNAPSFDVKPELEKLRKGYTSYPDYPRGLIFSFGESQFQTEQLGNFLQFIFKQ